MRKTENRVDWQDKIWENPWEKVKADRYATQVISVWPHLTSSQSLDCIGGISNTSSLE